METKDVVIAAKNDIVLGNMVATIQELIERNPGETEAIEVLKEAMRKLAEISTRWPPV